MAAALGFAKCGPPEWKSVFLVASGVLLILWVAAAIAMADADFSLLAKGPHERDAFAGKAVLITGASRGIGCELARYLAEQGAKLIISARSTAALQDVKAACDGIHAADIVVAPLDITAGPEAMEKFAAEADAAFDGLDYVFHVAGASQSAAAEDCAAGVAEQIFALNTLGPIALTRALLPRMLSRGRGRFTVVASMAARVPSPGQSLYAASKAGLFGYFSSLATELAGRGVGVTLVCPGPVAVQGATRTLFGAAGLETRKVDRRLQDNSKKVPMHRAVALICNAAAHGVDEAWIAKNPVLLAGYIMQFLPGLGWLLLKRIGPKRTQALKAGKSGYDYNLVSGAAKPKAKGKAT